MDNKQRSYMSRISRNRRHSTINILCFVYFVISFLLFSLVYEKGTTGFQYIYVPHIAGLVVHMHVGFTALWTLAFGFDLFFNNKSIRLDSICILLAFKCVTDFISYMLNVSAQTDSYFGYYACSVVSAVSYFICLQVSDEHNWFKGVLIAFACVLAVQSIWTKIEIPVSYFAINYKTYMQIPYAASNVIASIFVAFFFIAFYIKSKWKYAYMALIFVGLVLTKSRGGLLLFAITLFAFLFIKNCKKKDAVFKNCILIAVSVALGAILLAIPEVREVLSGYMSSGSDISSGRFELFSEVFIKSWEKPFFGHGLGVGFKNETGAHNLLIDLFYKCGIVGFIIYGLALGLLVYRAYKAKNLNSVYFCVLVILFLNSMFEVSYFSYKCDAIFWMIAGLLSSLSYKDKKKINKID